jgi:Zn finger protein HypA/HybF involved in hydrogenase expression
MAKKKKKCWKCKKTFEYTEGKYARKYCDKCSKENKKLWENQWKIKFEDCDEE